MLLDDVTYRRSTVVLEAGACRFMSRGMCVHFTPKRRSALLQVISVACWYIDTLSTAQTTQHKHAV
jgi:hypothetical protein